MNGLKYLVIVSLLLAIPCLGATAGKKPAGGSGTEKRHHHKKAHKHHAPAPAPAPAPTPAPAPAPAMAMDMDDPADDPVASEPMMGTMPDCKLVSPVLMPGEVYTTVEESCPPSSFDICKTIRARQHFTIEGGCKKECMKCDEYGKCEVVPCHEMCCKPVCKERCCKPRCHRERCCPKPRCCR